MTERKIRLLDFHTINQIAAGEVVENWGSVVKELVENALDAKATRILVETAPHLLRVIDNGTGISEEDLPIAIERHATSKLQEIDDLKSLHSLGFRGEALAAIASISKMSMHSAIEAENGAVFEVVGGKEGKIHKKARGRGTTVEVQDLFFNIPVRKNFLKSDRKENHEIRKILLTQALGNPSVEWIWKEKEKIHFDIGQDCPLSERISLLLGKEFSGATLPVEHQEGSYKLMGYIGRPFFHRPNRKEQYLFINQRAVFSPFISHEVLAAYATRLPSNRFPAFVLFLEMPREQVDVNVHPQKKEVRLQSEEKFRSFLLHAVEKALEAKQETRALSFHTPSFASKKDETFSSFLHVWEEEQKELPKAIQTSFCQEAKWKFLTKIGKYFFIQRDAECLLVDIHAVRQSLFYRSLLETNRDPPLQQQLLVPLTLDFTEMEKEILLENMELFCKQGISIRYFGQRTFLIDALVPWIAAEEVREILLAFVYGKGKPEKKMAYCLYKKNVLVEEGMQLIELFLQSSLANENCDGKPIFLKLSEKELEKKWYGSSEQGS